ncbi:MAG: N-acetylglucosamine-6-phosphate deacetylase [Spirochaetaceae bacterium]|jgi:N-acetylglucosamine-6-phosphate deacetylase|nr:N-acetylglucosamine-6-phosphate deacetylase [Spirochaetaceae bacterium]
MNSVCLHNGTILTGFSTIENCALVVENGHIADIFAEKRLTQKIFPRNTKLIDVQGAYIVPGFIDTHIHGSGGFGTEDETAESLLELSKFLVQYGVTAFNPTLYPSKNLPQVLAALVPALGNEQGAAVMGFHLEGPFLSPQRIGVQKPETLHAVDIPYMKTLYNAAKGHIVNMTVAPELKNMHDLALYCGKEGIVLQAGHTNAAYENMLEGILAGILHTTHLFNAMSAMEHRNPNAVGAALIHREMTCEIIADGHHVHKALFQFLLRDKSSANIVLVTDSLKPTGQAAPPFYANKEEVVFSSGLWTRKSDGVIAGSALTMIKGVENLTKFGFSLEDAVRAASTNPARIMGYAKKGAIIPGYDADLTVFDKNWNILTVIAGGQVVYGDA